LHYSHAMSDLRVCKYNDPQLRVRVSSYSHVALFARRSGEPDGLTTAFIKEVRQASGTARPDGGGS
jgi:hypothetical protein